MHLSQSSIQAARNIHILASTLKMLDLAASSRGLGRFRGSCTRGLFCSVFEDGARESCEQLDAFTPACGPCIVIAPVGSVPPAARGQRLRRIPCSASQHLQCL